MKERWRKIYHKFSDKRIVLQLFLGFSGGLPFLLTGPTLNHWLKKSNVSLTTISLVGIITAPYFLRFLWAPLVDRFKIPFFTAKMGQRRSWALLSQCCLVASIVALSFCHPADNIILTALCAFFVALSSATQDIVLDAYRVESLHSSEYGIGASNYVFGYRIGIMIAGSGAIFASTFLDWNVTYRILAVLMGIGMFTVLMSPEPRRDQKKESSSVPIQEKPQEKSLFSWYGQTIIRIFSDFSHTPKWIAILSFIMLYKVSDNLVGGMFNPFLLDMGFLDTPIAFAQNIGLWTSILGATLAGILISRFGLFNIMLLGGALEALTNLTFIILAKSGTSEPLLYAATIAENVTSGMAVSAFVAFLSSVCSVSYTATHYAMMTSLSSFGRVLVSLPAGWIAENFGWVKFFIVSAAAGVPAIILLFYIGPYLLNHRIDGSELDEPKRPKPS